MPDLALQRPQSFLQLTTTAIYTASGALLDNAIEYERAKIQAQSLCDIYYQASCAVCAHRCGCSSERDHRSINRNFSACTQEYETFLLYFAIVLTKLCWL
jgi:hypothetical protein